MEASKYDKPFEDKLKELGVPGEHSIFIMAVEGYGYELMTKEEHLKFASQGKDIDWFYNELKRRYEEKRESIYSSI